LNPEGLSGEDRYQNEWLSGFDPPTREKRGLPATVLSLFRAEAKNGRLQQVALIALQHSIRENFFCLLSFVQFPVSCPSRKARRSAGAFLEYEQYALVPVFSFPRQTCFVIEKNNLANNFGVFWHRFFRLTSFKQQNSRMVKGNGMIMRHFFRLLLTIIITLTVVGCAGAPTKEQLAAEQERQIHCEQILIRTIYNYKKGVATLQDVLNDIKTHGWHVDMKSINTTSGDKMTITMNTDLTIGCSRPIAQLCFMNYYYTTDQILYAINPLGFYVSIAKIIESVKHGGDGLSELQHFIAEGADVVNVTDGNGDTLLPAASEGGNKEIVELLLAKGADVNIKQNNGFTALIAASGKGHKEIVELLLAKGADVNAKDNDGGTALMYASGKYFGGFDGHKEIVELLLAKGAEVNAKNNNGRTALMFAAFSGQIEIVEFLLAKGAEVNAKNNSGRTALMIASTEVPGALVGVNAKGHKEVVELLIRAGAK
jgi:hypothetical protein